MRRGASVSSTEKRTPVAADLHDLEGGGNAAYNGNGSPALVKSLSRGSSGNLSSSSDLDLYAGDSQKKDSRRVSRAYLGSGASPDQLRGLFAVLVIGTLILFPFLPVQWSIILLVISSCCFGSIASLWLSRAVLQCDDGTAEMRAVSDPIREGAEGFLRVQYSAIASFAVPLAGLIVLSYQFRPSTDEPKGVAVLGNTMLGM